MTEAELQGLLLTVISSQGRRCGLGIGRLVAPPAGVHHDKDMHSRRRLEGLIRRSSVIQYKKEAEGHLEIAVTERVSMPVAGL